MIDRIFLSEQQAIDLLPEGERIHTFLNAPLALIGSDWSREDVIDKIRRSDFREVAGNGARSMEHGLAVYDSGYALMDVVFFETDMEKLNVLYPAEEET